MDNVDRMFRHLVRTVRSRYPQYLTQPFDVGELHQTILPYRLNRRELALESNDDYEITLTELLSGVRGYLIVDDQMREALSAELASVNPDPTAFKQFASARIAISPAALRSLAVGAVEEPTSTNNAAAGAPPHATSRSAAPAASAPAAAPTTAPAAPRAAAPVAAPVTAAPARSNTPNQTNQSTPRTSTAATQRVGAQTITPNVGDHCRSCDEVLPAGRPITFCPHCGQNLTTMNCQGCGSELELGWKFCPACGRRTAVQ